jgi:hypothetical protein
MGSAPRVRGPRALRAHERSNQAVIAASGREGRTAQIGRCTRRIDASNSPSRRRRKDSTRRRRRTERAGANNESNLRMYAAEYVPSQLVMLSLQRFAGEKGGQGPQHKQSLPRMRKGTCVGQGGGTRGARERSVIIFPDERTPGLNAGRVTSCPHVRACCSSTRRSWWLLCVCEKGHGVSMRKIK